MEGIYYNEGIYLVIDNITKSENLIYHNQNCFDRSLYGGRVKITSSCRGYSSYSGDGYLHVDGIPIVRMESKNIHKELSLSAITSHLNAIEVHGVDAFLENYKKSVEFLYRELKEIDQKTESLLTTEKDDLILKNLLLELEKNRTLLLSVLAILFCFHTNMSAAL